MNGFHSNGNTEEHEKEGPECLTASKPPAPFPLHFLQFIPKQLSVYCGTSVRPQFLMM
ncbi:MAG: hypothetical protein JSV33_11210 [bacterium]|nr:MAG: hypothetical protein JSV33_11210 [bacterium]